MDEKRTLVHFFYLFLLSYFLMRVSLWVQRGLVPGGNATYRFSLSPWTPGVLTWHLHDLHAVPCSEKTRKRKRKGEGKGKGKGNQGVLKLRLRFVPPVPCLLLCLLCLLAATQIIESIQCARLSPEMESKSVKLFKGGRGGDLERGRIKYKDEYANKLTKPSLGRRLASVSDS